MTKFYDPEQLENAKSYYTLMGWDVDTGIPTPEKLEELEITLVKFITGGK